MEFTIELPKNHNPPSLLHGPNFPPLQYKTLGEILDEQSALRGDNEAIICPSMGVRWSYNTLHSESLHIAQGLLAFGIKSGDRIGILAGNCAEYVAVFFAASYVGAVLVVLNNTYTTQEATYALKHSSCRLLFTVPKIGRASLRGLINQLGPRPRETGRSKTLENVIMLRHTLGGFMTYSDLKKEGRRLGPEPLDRARRAVYPDDTCNLQYTSGSTGHPKAAMLTHFNLINNATSIGDRLDFTEDDILCCPPPLFHCFGLVLGVLAVLSHGAKIVLPAETFDARAVLRALSDENCTALHGVPTMFEEILNLPRPEGWSCRGLRTGIIAGAPVPRPLMRRLLSELNMTEFTSSYGLTEASPTCFNAFTADTIDTRLSTVGRLLPHLKAKIIDSKGRIVPQGKRGELCISGYSLQKGYWNNSEKTNEVMIRDENGVLWLHTGDEASFTEDGYCTITGRFKDIIIRGGENIYPVEIEVRLSQHPVVSRAVVVGVRDPKFGEVVGAFLLHERLDASSRKNPSDDELRGWSREVLGRHKAPAHIFWFGEEGVPTEVPQTGSGKVKKPDLRLLAEKVVAERLELKTASSAKL
ncbi:hypothetical protein BJ875DRAFT_463155 [Amylocarpus encephaloides]|uniref:Uncharacterized protein n=1 Tax=Amylocarpus encephaloides TaxID=45428 RepID=A0A9P8C546_9HELO|nr:hypothetical protein BJ875DRAFT_463155 [Amylocarpus encephaloides]